MKTDVYSWRVAPELKRALEAVARERKESVAKTIEHIANAWLAKYRAARRADAAHQERLHAAARRAIGTIAGGDPHRSERARDSVRRKLAERHAR